MTYGFSGKIDPRSGQGKKLLLVFLFIGALFLTVAAVLFGVHCFRVRQYVRTDARIVSLDQSKHPTVRFEAEAGTVDYYFGSMSSSTFRVGDRLEVAYDPEDPDTVIITGLLGYLAAAILGGIGLIFVAVGGGMYYACHGKRAGKKGLA